MLKKFSSTVVLACLVLVCDFQSFSQDHNWNDEPISAQHFELLEKKAGLIRAQVEAENNEWQGAYEAGDHHPTILMWSESEGFLAWGSHHTFYPSRINFGKIKFADNLLTLSPEINRDHLNFQPVAHQYVPVKWDEHHFLIPKEELIEFAYAVHDGGPVIDEYFVKTKDLLKPRKGLPNLPEEYLKFCKMSAIKPKVLSVQAGKDIWDKQVTLNLGSNSKIIEGMWFYYNHKHGQIKLNITSVTKTSSKAKLMGISTYLNYPTLKLKAGLIFSSKYPYQD